MNLFDIRQTRCGSVLLLVGCLAPIAACHTATSAHELAATTGLATRAPLADADVVRAIQRYLQDERLLRSEPVQVAVTQGVAILSGSVSNLLAKKRALRVAETIRGVRAVVDQTIVAPIARTDEQLTSDVRRTLSRDMATRTYAIGVESKSGKVTLSGTADSWQQKRLFADVAETVPGVKALDNAVTVHYTILRPDSEIAADVKYRIANDAWLDGATLSVAVTDETVHVSGIVASVAQRARARSDGWVAGVDSVDDDGVVVDWLAQDDQKQAKSYRVTSDSQIGQAVNAAFRVDPRLKTLIPQVAVRNGVVVLSGLVDSPKARRSAEADAKDTTGVWIVRDEVVVQPDGKPTDIDIEHGVQKALAEDLALSGGKSIQVSSSAKGKIELKGTVASGFERLDAIEDVESVPGVAEVDDNLVINRPPADIKDGIESRLFWDPMVQRDRVRVAVAADRVATLTGTVDAWSGIKAATEDALAGGALRVINSLQLRNHPEVSPP